MKEGLYKEFFENSLDPFIIFDENANVIEYNKEGEYVLSCTDKNELFNLALNNASQNFGFKITFIELDIGHSSFCAINVGYIDSSHIGLVLHKNVCNKKYRHISSNLQMANIFTLFDIAINTNLEDTKIVKNYDVSIPEFKIDINTFLQFLNRIFKQLKKAPLIEITIKMNTGETVVIEGKKYKIISIDIKGGPVRVEEGDFVASPLDNGIHIELPFIL